MNTVFVCKSGGIMEQNQVKAAAVGGGRYYPRKMRRGWCVAHRVSVCGVAIERFGVNCPTYAEAFSRADRMNREEAAAPEATESLMVETASGGTGEHFPDVRKGVQP